MRNATDMTSSKASDDQSAVSVPLTVLSRGQRGQLNETLLDESDKSMLRALGLRPDCSLRVCRQGHTCIVALDASCGGGCRIGLSRDIASRVMVTPRA